MSKLLEPGKKAGSVFIIKNLLKNINKKTTKKRGLKTHQKIRTYTSPSRPSLKSTKF